MGLTADDYLAQLQALLPLGAAWPRDQDSSLTKLLSAWSDEFSRVDSRAWNLMEEADPRTTSELLLDWERVTGLPDPCVTSAQTVDQRRAALVALLITLGGQSRQYFIDMAAALGYPGATIDEYRPMNCGDNCNDALWSDTDRFVWQINLPTTGGTYIMNCDSTCDAPLGAWGGEAIECRINRYKPAHTQAVFAYIAP